MCVDLHTHSIYSDGTATPAELIRMAAANKLKGFALTDHDTTEGVRETIRSGLDLDVPVISGLEISALHHGYSLHILGYGIDPENPELNRWLHEAVAKHEPSMARRGYSKRPIKFFYATQTGVRPPSFVLFCTEPQAIQTSYRRCLENRLRETVGFEGTPIRLTLRTRKR